MDTLHDPSLFNQFQEDKWIWRYNNNTILN